MKTKRNICDIHDDIRGLAIKILNMNSRQYEEVSDALADAQSLADEIVTLSELAKDAGCSMENRMSAYRDAIESLGFKRI